MADVTGKTVNKLLLQCLLCRRQFSLRQVRAGELFGDTGICRECYRDMENDRTCCFGRDKKNGFNEEAIECREFCPDKRICKLAIQEGLG